ncbi:anti-sigma factor domain-containing protein [Fictibacillus sp. BK138]|uniref:anti-sigma factor domain-containing protein n=1 Tax=Fictibacillus sp. BK138 TaxID=2512121 RepID=UPI00102906DF|nr:anti-sigma factor domain-containing protein [Fictibacillus sp. BK138]RZT21904.1 anti-sigma factor-like protein [Fictibacillus sp. BK138]
MNKAIIVEVNSRHLIVLAEGGEFKKVKNTNPAYTVGQEIMIPVLKEKKDSIFSVFINWKTATAAALAIFLLFFQVLSPMSTEGAYAYVGMDMDPSLELKINEEMQVLSILSFNEQGDTVLEHMGDWEEKEIGYVTNLIFEACEDLGYLKTKEEVLITTTLSEEIPENKEKEMKEKVNEVMTETAKKKSVEMTTIVMSSKEREKAKKMKISPGHYAIYTAAKKSGIKISAKEVSGHTIEEISKKVGPIKELLEENDEKISTPAKTEEIDQVYEPPLPILDNKAEEVEEVKEKTAVAVQEKVKNTRKEKAAKPKNTHSIIAAEPKKEEKAPEPVKKEAAKNKDVPLTAAAAAPPKEEKPKEEKPKEEKPKEEKPKEAKPKVDLPPADPEEPPVQTEPEPTTEPESKEWIYIEIIIDNLVITVKIKSDSNLLKEDLKKQALAIINQNHLLLQNQSLAVSPEELKGLAAKDQTTNQNTYCEQKADSAAEFSTQKAS